MRNSRSFKTRIASHIKIINKQVEAKAESLDEFGGKVLFENEKYDIS